VNERRFRCAGLKLFRPRSSLLYAMLLRLFRLLLIVSLVLNGFVSAWAMPAHAGHGGHLGSQDHATHAQPKQHSMHDHAAMKHAAMDLDLDLDLGPGDGASGNCCQGASCHCGCLMPPMLPAVGLCGLAHFLVGIPPSATAPEVLAIHATAPFRPPAV